MNNYKSTIKKYLIQTLINSVKRNHYIKLLYILNNII